MTLGSRYLNTDLYLISAEDPTPLIRALETRADVLFFTHEADGKWYATIEADGSGEPDSEPRRDIDSLIAALDSLDADCAAILAACERREMNVGWQAAAERPEGSFALEPAALAAMTRHGMIFAVTVYPSSEADL